MLKCLAAASLLLAACDSPRRVDAPKDSAPLDTYVVPPDVPPPTVDAAPPPAMACTASAPTCQLPPSACVDPHYIVYYTDGMCVADQCRYTEHLMYCAWGCVNGGCSGGFT